MIATTQDGKKTYICTVMCSIYRIKCSFYIKLVEIVRKCSGMLCEIKHTLMGGHCNNFLTRRNV